VEKFVFVTATYLIFSLCFIVYSRVIKLRKVLCRKSAKFLRGNISVENCSLHVSVI